VDHLNLVINLDIPENKEIYVHRIGRTGRAGRPGTAITLVTPSQKHFIWGLEKSLDMKLTRIEIPSDAQVAILQRNHLATELAAPEQPSEHGAKWLQKLAKQYNWSPEETAARALAVLALRDGVSLVPEDECDQEPPRWAKDPRKTSDRKRTWRNDRDRRPYHKDRRERGAPSASTNKHDGGPKDAGPSTDKKSKKNKKGKKNWYKKAR
jgi:ATP-dependent RNA helicase DeaD